MPLAEQNSRQHSRAALDDSGVVDGVTIRDRCHVASVVGVGYCFAEVDLTVGGCLVLLREKCCMWQLPEIGRVSQPSMTIPFHRSSRSSLCSVADIHTHSNTGIIDARRIYIRTGRRTNFEDRMRETTVAMLSGSYRGRGCRRLLELVT